MSRPSAAETRAVIGMSLGLVGLVLAFLEYRDWRMP